MAKCKVCGFRLADGLAKCPICEAMSGSKQTKGIVHDVERPRYFCPSCNAEIIFEYRYCPACGKDLSQVANKFDVHENDSNSSIHHEIHFPVAAKFRHECGTKHEASNILDRLKEAPLKAFKYEILDGEYILKGLANTSLTDIVIPRVFSKIAGKKIRTDDNEFEFVSGFSYPVKLKGVIIPDTITEIGDGAFTKCRSLTTAIIPGSVTKIGKDAFWNCQNLTSITIPNSVTEMGERAFEGCNKVTTITIASDNPKYKAENNVVYTKDGTNLIFAAGGLSTVKILDNVTTIGSRAFAYCKYLKNITIANSITEICDDAFA